MFNANKWYYYRNRLDIDCRYKFTQDSIKSGKVYIILAQYPDNDVQVWAQEDYDTVQQIMRCLTMTNGEEK